MRQIIFILVWIPMVVFASTEALLSQEYDMPKVRGEYHNCNFGYSVTIPKGFVGIADSGPAQPVQNHGFRIQLSTSSDCYIGVDGYSNSAGWASSEEMVDAYVETIRKHAKGNVAVQKRRLKLNGYPALRATIRYQNSDSNKHLVYDMITIVSLKQERCYKLTLECEEGNYEEYRHVFEQLASTWRLYPCEEGGVGDDPK